MSLRSTYPYLSSLISDETDEHFQNNLNESEQIYVLVTLDLIKHFFSMKWFGSDIYFKDLIYFIATYEEKDKLYALLECLKKINQFGALQLRYILQYQHWGRLGDLYYSLLALDKSGNLDDVSFAYALSNQNGSILYDLYVHGILTRIFCQKIISNEVSIQSAQILCERFILLSRIFFYNRMNFEYAEGVASAYCNNYEHFTQLCNIAGEKIGTTVKEQFNVLDIYFSNMGLDFLCKTEIVLSYIKNIEKRDLLEKVRSSQELEPLPPPPHSAVNEHGLLTPRASPELDEDSKDEIQEVFDALPPINLRVLLEDDIGAVSSNSAELGTPAQFELSDPVLPPSLSFALNEYRFFASESSPTDPTQADCVNGPGEIGAVSPKP